MTEPITKRCTAKERRAFTAWRVATSYVPNDPGPVRVHKCSEPALGTLEQRLSIIAERLGAGKLPPSPIRRARHQYVPKDKPGWDVPALGSTEQRLGIIIRRLGGSTAEPTATADERDEYLTWLRTNDPTADNPYAAREAS